MFAKRSLWAALGSAALFSSTCWATEAVSGDSDALTLTPRPATVSAAPATDAKPAGTRPLMLDDAASEKPNIHGFASVTFGTSYVTPRGLVVENAGLVVQPVVGIVVPVGDVAFVKNLAVITGVWNSINTAQDDPNVGAWNEMDFFFSLAGGVGPGLTATLTYGAWNFPQSTTNKPETEHNIDLKIAYADKWFGDAFSVNPYVDLFWAVAGSSTVVQGATGQTGYVELGIVPTFKLKGLADLPPILITVPTYFSVGPSEYWGGDSNFGVLSVGLNLSLPLNFIPGRYGSWHFDVGAQYYNFLNGTLLDSGTILSGNTERNFVRGYVGVGMSF